MVVEEARDGAEGFEMIQKAEYDLVLCDIDKERLADTEQAIWLEGSGA